MEFRKKYVVRRKMHSRPLSEVAQEALDICREDKGVKLGIRGSRREVEGDFFNNMGILSLHLRGIGSSRDSDIEVSIEGDYDQEKLEGYADRIGRIFETEIVEELSIYEELVRMKSER
ncbi:MAG: hypothetical protein U9Q06_03530 [Nanoarchaeota archaeon]|nr:hypothetical protein [Nanoarchaeota archaeon]